MFDNGISRVAVPAAGREFGNDTYVLQSSGQDMVVCDNSMADMISKQSRTGFLRNAVGATAVATLGFPAIVRAQTRITLNIGAGNIEGHAQGYYARAQGFFEQNGIDAQIQTLRNGASIASAVSGGELQVGVSSVLQLAEGRGKGLPFNIITPGALHDGRVAHTTNLCVAPNSPISSAAQLNGKVIAVSTLNGLDQIIDMALIDKAGGDSKTVKFLEVPPNAAAEAVLRGRVDAAQLDEPQLSAAGTTVKRLGDGEDAIAERFVTTGWFTTDSWLNGNKDAARRFSNAIFQAGAWAMKNPEAAAQVLQKVLSLTISRGTQVFASARVPSEEGPLLTTAVRYKLAAPVNVSQLFWDGR
jgi:NitT/TauT family transport system substrate-binding protein